MNFVLRKARCRGESRLFVIYRAYWPRNGSRDSPHCERASPRTGIDRLEHQPIRFPDIQSGHNPKVEDWLQNRLVDEDEGDTPHLEVSARSEVSSHSVQPGPMNSLVKYRKPEPVAIRPEEPITVWNIQSETLLRGAYNAY